MTTTDASATIWRWPRESENGASSEGRPKRAMTAAARSRASFSPTPCSVRPNATSSSTVSLHSWWSGFWNSVEQWAAIALVGTSRVSSPAMRTVPDAGRKRPFRSLVSVVFPAPFWPTMPTTSPG